MDRKTKTPALVVEFKNDLLSGKNRLDLSKNIGRVKYSPSNWISPLEPSSSLEGYSQVGKGSVASGGKKWVVVTLLLGSSFLSSPDDL